MDELRAENLPADLAPSRRELLIALSELWFRLCDLRFGQLCRVAVEGMAAHPTDVTDDALREDLPSALARVPERTLPTGPYWDTERGGQGSFINGRPRDPARIPALMYAFAHAWSVHQDLYLGQLIDYALDRAGIPENEFGTRWLLIEDAPMIRALKAIANEPWHRRGGDDDD